MSSSMRGCSSDEKKELGLALVEIAHESHEQCHIVLMLPQGGRRWMFARGGEVGAVARTRDFRQPLRAAADSADLLAERRTPASRLSLAAQRTHHSSTIVFPQPLL
jgi:hypothetical protein